MTIRAIVVLIVLVAAPLIPLVLSWIRVLNTGDVERRQQRAFGSKSRLPLLALYCLCAALSGTRSWAPPIAGRGWERSMPASSSWCLLPSLQLSGGGD